MGRKPGTKQVSVTADSARPGGPSTMDALIAWITKPGNVKRWRSEPRAPLIREIVDMMHGEGLVHRKAPFVRYKVDDIEKKYLLAKQWLLETGMHDAFMRGKATPEVRAHVERTCPLFRKLDPAFHGVPFSKKNAETIELDDSAEDGESAEESKQEIEVPDDSEDDDDEDDEDDEDEDDSEDDENEDEDEGSSSDSDSDGAESEEVYDGEEEVEEAEDEEVATKKGKKKAAAAEAASQKASTPSRFKELLLARTAEAEKASEPKKAKKKATLKETMLATTPEKAKAVVKEKKKAPTSVEKQKKEVVVAKERVLLKVDEKKTKKKAVASKERVLLKVGAKEKSPARPQKKADSAETPASATAAKVSKAAEKKKADSAETRASAPAPATKVAEKKKKTSKPAEPLEKKTVSKSKEPPVLSSAVEAALEQVAPSTSKPEAVESTPEPVKKRRGRPPKSATAASPSTNGVKETTPKANGKKPLKASATKRKAAEEETTAVKTTPTQQKEAETATKRARTQQQGEESAAKRARTQEQDEAERKTMVAIEREALLKRIEDEQKQRHDVYELERSKLQCELAAKQVQLLFEKATARKKLDQLGVPQEEIDRLLPL